ncbi:MarR family winged helix-turn-helix transcriptional regulator [Oceanirhabdus seepicola]|uniref:MarR family winged helix-turn-helix transcriptional regulator n=1 Tax=Oceanirhabdus seepicola TaxID=2828781 RepID=UPI002032E361
MSIIKDLDKSYEIIRSIKSVKESLKHNFHKRFKDLNLTAPQGMLIGILVRKGQMKISDLSEEMALSNSTVSGIIDRLEKNKFVERKRSEEDRRVVMVDVTESFRKEAEKRFKTVEDSLSTVLKLATPEEEEKVLIGLDILDKLLNRVKDDNNSEE